MTETHDFNGDGRADLLWRNEETGDNIIWLMNGTNIIAGGSLPNVESRLGSYFYRRFQWRC
ncbi:FG-GAP repeat protein [Chroococcidiopsis cubana]|uniref:FG-GAP repeat domain-containing protein n=1 Tax=Chroococcidiopsis cubana TaxID=171392 RepID=UPI002ACECA77|nr:FG-GAP repeat protein [Chroococcidiopsis cubana]